MSKNIIIGVVALIVIAGVGTWWYMSSTSTSSNDMGMTAEQMNEMNTSSSSASTDTGDTGATPAASGTSQSSTLPTSGTSDTDLTQDAASIDTQMNGLNSDNASADNGLNSQ